MLYTAIMRFKENLTQDERDLALAQREIWKYPHTMKVLGEYWLSSPDIAVMCLFETEDISAILETELNWGRFFNIEIVPTVPVEKGLKLSKEIVARLRKTMPTEPVFA